MAVEGVNRPELAKRTKKSVATVGRWLQRGLPSDDPHLYPIAKALNCSVAYLLGDRDDPGRGEYLTTDEWVMLRIFRDLKPGDKRAFVTSMQEAQEAVEKARQS